MIYQLALSQIPLIGPVLARNLVGYCGGAEAVFSEKLSLLRKIPGIGERHAQEVYGFKDFDRIENEIVFLRKNNIKTTFFTEDDYPYRLRQIADAPLMLFRKGDIDLDRQRVIAIVGTRKCTQHSKELTDHLIENLKAYSPIIISGLAYGIDSIAHKSAIKHGLATLGVLGHGLDRIYPGEHKTLAQQMIDSGGGLMTEFMSNSKPDRENFPKRNRIVAGLSDAVLVIETPRKGGSIITANLAFDYDREVMAVPGRGGDPQFGGCNSLIKTHKAHLIEDASDITRILNWDLDKKPKKSQFQLPLDLSSREQLIFETLREHGALDLDILCQKVEVSTSKLAIILLELEFKSVVRCLPGKQYELV